MKKIFRKFPEAILVTFALFILGVLIAYYIWGLGVVVQEIDQAMNSKNAGGGSPGFNLRTAQQLDFRGLVKTTQ